MDWGDYRPYVPVEDGPMEDMDPKAARREFDHRMATKDERLAVLAALVEANGLRLGTDDEALDALEAWYRAEVEPDPDHVDTAAHLFFDSEGGKRPRPVWIAVAYDLGLQLGETIIARAPGLSWTFYSSRKGSRDVSHQHAVIMGFTNVRNKRYNADPFRFAVGVGGSHLSGSDKHGDFRQYVDFAVSCA
ncbi:hypothetical protein AB0G79_20455 [Streptomyces sp. NPDC020807]|uniref:hypothetical protein n=1 Tax=Streptomyces sp. NPDC020807 TaxID=3155119 RepID=UPI0033E5B552